MPIVQKDSPLTCISYHLISLNLVSNPDYKPEKAHELSAADLKILSSQSLVGEPQNGLWQIKLKVQQSPDLGKNPPYLFALEIIGHFKVKDFPEDKKATLVAINGSSVLFSAAREIILSLTGRGPNKQINLPTIAFLVALEPPPVPVANPPSPVN